MKPKPVVGQRLYSVNIGNAARNTKQVITPVVVSKVGRKYFSVTDDIAGWRDIEYHLDTWRERTNYTANSALYESEQEWLDEKEANDLWSKIRQEIQYSYERKLSLKQLREIAAIIGLNTSLAP